MLEIHTGRVASVRLGPNEDIVESLEQAGAQLGFRRALVRGGLGSLIDAAFEGTGGEPRRIEGPAVEILSMSGEISLEQGVEAAGIWGVVGDPTGAVWAGRFVRGLNLVCITVEAVLEELVPAPEEDWRRPF